VNAYPSIQGAIDDPRSATEAVWIAKGAYEETLALASGRELYGGFLPGATSFAQRDPFTNYTNLDLRVVAAPNHGITLTNVQNVVVDGIRILSGKATGGDLASGSGGGMYCDGADDSNRVEKCTFSENSAAGDGGAVVCLNGASPRFADCKFLTNIATGRGGAVYCAPGSLASFDQCTFEGNQANNGGGGVYAERAAPVVADSTFSGNLSGNGGGGFHFDHTSGTLTRCDFDANQDNIGGAISADNGSTPLFDACDFFYNHAGIGGAIFTRQGAKPAFNDCRIEGNTSANDGGAIACFNEGSVTMNRCVISGNMQVAGRGAALFAFNNTTIVLSFTNCVISGNSTSEEAAIYVALANADFQNCTISGNVGNDTAGGAYCGPQSDLRFTNCLFSGNQQHAVAVVDPASYPTLVTCLFYDNAGGDVLDQANAGAIYSGDDIGTFFPTGKAEGNFAGDPRFVMDGAAGISGTWTAAATYSAATDLTTFIDGSATFSPHALAGRRINVTARTFEFPIVDNTTTTVLIQGDRARVGAGNPYRIIDYHLGRNSEALDGGEAGNAPVVDIEGEPRPVDIFGVGFDGLGQGYDIGAYEYQVVGMSASPEIVDFGPAPFPGGLVLKTVTLRNDGTATVNYVAMIEDDGEGNFALQQGGASGMVGVGESRELTVGFSPASEGAKSATVAISSDGFPSIVKVYLFGVGTGPVRVWMLH